MNPTLPQTPAAESNLPLNIPDSETISKTMLIGFLVGCRVPIAWNAPVGMVLSAIKKLAECAENHNAKAAAESPLAALPNNQTMNANPEPDYSTLTPLEAGLLFNSYITELEKTLGLDKATARLRVKTERPALFARMTVNDAPDAALANAANTLPPEPVFSPQMKALLKLPSDADSEETSVAWKATKGFTSPPDFKAIWKLMLALWGGRIRAENRQADDTWIGMKVRERFPELARQAATQS